MATGSSSLNQQCVPNIWSLHCKYGTWLLFLLVLFCVSSLAQPTEDTRYLKGYRPLQVFNGITEGNVFTIPSDKEVFLLLYGDNISNDTHIKFTVHSESCDDQITNKIGGDFVELYPPNINLTNASPDAQFSLRLNLPVPSETTYYFCVDINGTGEYEHQGSGPWVTIIVQPPVLPLWLQIIFIIALMILSGLFSGLNLGLMALDPTTLKIITQSGTKRQRTYAKIIYRVRRHGNYLLCTLLLGNVVVNSTLTILLDGVLPGGIYAVIASTLAIVIFGEIIPQAICSRHGLLIGAWTIPLTLVFMVLTFPLSFPLSLILNRILGKEIGAVYNRDQLLKLLHVTQEHHDLVEDEVNIISGVLAFKKKTAEDVMTKFEDVFCISIDGVLDFRTMRDVYDSGFSRIPVYEGEKNNIVGLLYVRDLAFVDPDDQTSVQSHIDFYKHELLFFWQETTLDELLKGFTAGKCHMGIIQKVNNETEGDPFYEVVGVVTLEDIIEEILQQEIVDETDRFVDNRSKKLHKRKNFDVGEFDNPSDLHILSSHQRLAVFQFLSSAVEPFHEEYISHNVLKRLLSKNVVRKLSLEESNRTNLQLYTVGKEASFFTLVLEGCMEVKVGKDGLTFESKSFTTFGAQVLLNSIMDTPVEYIPDYTVRLITDSTVIIVTRRQYLAAREASRFEEGISGASVQTESGEGDNTEQQNGDVFAKEWELAETEDIEASHSKGSGLSSITKLLHKKQRSKGIVSQQSNSSDQYHLLTQSSSDNSDSSEPGNKKRLLSKRSTMELEDRYDWFPLSDDGSGEANSSRNKQSVGDRKSGPAELHSVTVDIQDYSSEPNAVRYRTREDWVETACTEV